MTADTKLINVTLSTYKDWDDWLFIIQTQALDKDVWEYINPAVANLPRLEPPIALTYSDVHPGATQYTALTQDERDTFKTLHSEYKAALKIYETKRKAIANIRTEIVKTIKRDYISYLRNLDSVHAMLCKLRDRLAPNDDIRK